MHYFYVLSALLIGFLATPGQAAAQSSTEDQYTLVWSDEFDRDGAVDPANWQFEKGFVRNREAQWYQEENAYCKNGLLIIEARKEKKPNPGFQPGSSHWARSRPDITYTSSSINTRGKHSWQYGRFEMRARIPVGAGLWPAFWTLGVSGEWPSNGEIDIMEYYRGMLLANIACGTDTRWEAHWFTETRTIESLGGKDWADQFHVWRMDWDENEIALYVDDLLLNRVPLSKLVNRDGTGINPFRQPHYMLLNFALGGMNGGEIDDSLLPAVYEIDYVRVYQKQNAPVTDYEADIIIYGGTSAAIISAVQAKKMGKSVLVVSPDVHLGGLSSGGLGYTDTGNKNVIGGLSRDFYHRVWQHYHTPEAWKWQKQSAYGNKGQGTAAMDSLYKTMWIFEPHVAEQVFEDYVREFEIPVLRDEWLDREQGVQLEGGRIVSFETLSGKVIRGKVFIDATYEGDLMAASGVSYHVGRESSATYNEKWNGVQTGVLHHGHWFKSDISPYIVPGDSTSGLVWGVSPEHPGEYGAADDKIQAYCFRVCMSNHPENRVPFPKPDDYDPSRYELLARVFESGWREWFRKFDEIPNRKTDTNNHGPFSSDAIGMNYDYPEASYERRKEIIREHESYQKGLLWFVANDPRVPQEVRAEMENWGLAKDEFTDNGNWPHQLYIREARRMVGEFVTTENELLKKSPVPKPVGMGSYTMDSHNVQRYIKPDGYVQNEGDIGVSTKGPYQIAYGSLVPKKEECTNLLVPVCVSSSHIAFGSIRMEPVFMILGQSAATAAALAIDGQVAVQDVNYSELKEKLLEDGAVLEYAQ